MKNTFLILVILVCAYSCTDEVTIPSRFENPELVVDAWLTTEPTSQEIKLTYTQDFIDTTVYRGNSDAEIVVNNITQNKVFNFDSKGMGSYIYESGSIAEVGDSLVLNIEVDNSNIISSTKVYRTAKLDSIALETVTGEIGREDGVYAELYATDQPGIGDSYWIRTFRNDTLLNKAAEMNLAYDAAFESGSGLDGIQFIRPIRARINGANDEGRQMPYKPGDSIRCEVHSISDIAFSFMKIAQEQALNGDNTIFALPVYNAQGNIVDQDSKTVLGVFNVAKVASITKVVD